ncbi:MAG: diguanylate cyclase [Bradyrhizobium sp.]|nr:diguanylate cyclase [Bradyrhizobium sp.]
MTANIPSALSSKFLVPRRSIRGYILSGALLIAAIAFGTAMMVSHFRERALKDTNRELENTVLLLARHYDQQFEEFEVVQKELVGYIRSTGIASTEAFKRQMSSQDMRQILKNKSNGSPDVAGINIFDSDGMLINSSVWPRPTANVADRAYFKAAKLDPASTQVSIELVRSRLAGKGWTALISRTITGPSGEFLGLVTRGIATASFENFFAPLALGNDAAISMFLRDGTMIARHPHIDDLIGLNFSKHPFFEVLANADHGNTRSKSVVEGQDRLGSVRQLNSFPIVVVATTSVEAALADWRDQTRLLIGAAGMSVLVIVTMMFFILRQLSLQHRRLGIAINNMTQSLLMFDSSNRLIICNQRYLEMFRLSAKVVRPGCSFRDLIAHRKDVGYFSGDVDKYCTSVLRNVGLCKTTLNVVDIPDGRSIQFAIQPLADGGWIATLEDVTERKRSDERIAHLAHFDALTDLPNRGLFQEQLEGAIARIVDDEQVALLYIDIDEFKYVNDSLGHRIGDELLKSVAASLKDCLDGTNIVSRLGGDEFAVVQTAVKGQEDITALITRIYHSIRGPHECLGHLVTTDASIGIALASRHSADLEQLLKNADLAMYSAKAAGRRTWRFFEPEMDARMKARHSLEIDLRRAIIEGGFEVYYQPIVDLQSNKVCGCEALLRWNHPQRGMISPADFIPIAEDTGLINQLGEWVLMTGCAEAATWPDDIKIAINVSPVQFRSDTLALKVVAALAASGLSASRLELEITEAVLIRDDDAALAILHQLRALGVRIALDDFGTGYSSLSYLQRFPFDKIKIDRCFIKDIAEPSGASCIVQAVVSIAETRHMTTTAEGVETEQQREILRGLGCTQMQGYLFSSAKPATEIRRLLLSNHDKAVA